jgi:hypothetical protein
MSADLAVGVDTAHRKSMKPELQVREPGGRLARREGIRVELAFEAYGGRRPPELKDSTPLRSQLVGVAKYERLQRRPL